MKKLLFLLMIFSCSHFAHAEMLSDDELEEALLSATSDEEVEQILEREEKEYDRLKVKCDNSALRKFNKNGKLDQEKIAQAAKQCKEDTNITICKDLFDVHPACFD